jgi:hypothetical protein
MKFSARILVAIALLVSAHEIIGNTLELDHIIGGDFTLRSKYTIKNKVDGNPEIILLEADKNRIAAEEIGDFKKKLTDNGLYRIRVQVRGSDSSIKSSVSASIPACELQRSGFKEDLVIHLDNSNNVIGLAYSSPEMAISRPCDPNAVSRDWMITSL